MLRIVRLCERLPRPATASRGAAVLVLAVAAGGCSAGFEMPSLSYNGGPAPTSSVPIPREPVYQNRGYAPPSEERSYGQPYGQPYSQPYSPPNDGGYERPYSPPYQRQPPRQEWRESNRGTPVSEVGERGVRVAGLPEAYDRNPPSQAVPSYAPHHTSPASPPYRSVEPPPPAPSRATFDAPPASPVAQADGDTIEVRAGDTLYALSRKHGVSVSELMRANHLEGPQLRIGQRLIVPSSPRRVAALPRAPMAEPAPAPAVAPPARERPEPRLPHHEVGPIVPPLVETEPATPAAAPAPAAVPAERVAAPVDDSGWMGAYTVERGDSLYAIARKHNVRLNELERVNKITDPRRVRPGTVLKVPQAGDAPRVAAAPATPPSARSESASAPFVEPTIINARTRVAALGSDASNPPSGPAVDTSPTPAPAATDVPVRDAAVATPKAAAPTAKFRWPARGKIISSFGPQSRGHNDGINIALPRGAEVYAAEAGVVTYAGDGVQGYGNLLLIRHDGGWITAYAHNDTLAVKSGETVRRGQVIAKAGATGSVDTPQLHFEIRQGTKPVDPIQHLER
jgi:murein DD-endopeptidase MepM/ murein hydrolase activator NlpD